ncbi:MAG: hypothetical protein ABJC98_03365 [Bacteroidota bacterium]
MKKLLLIIILGTATIAMINIPGAKAENSPVIRHENGNSILSGDTIPTRKGDSTKWDRKKYPDTAQMPRKDTLQHK